MGRNPCYNGRCISTVQNRLDQLHLILVAILVIMEDVFLLHTAVLLLHQQQRRNPCYNGRCISTK